MDKFEKAERARALLEDEFFAELVSELRAEAIARFERAALSDSAAMVEARLRLEGINSIVERMKTLDQRGSQ